ncbi:iron-sulfur cluster insertion protein ErpA [Methylocystis heyeri]|uniref:Iron-sulfur cluster insertion protein ErpA n=1 Tax=Methylocystis heyeri TaxID=391905 RepID=A0A6B8KE43_9HYPH|nr:iron-sulfur cluster insertion protein ErpA [Methylocystis heyeri]QGM44828.1 iron-sulfur cluster insertion protein ErpA [Methylocystis heyeri]
MGAEQATQGVELSDNAARRIATILAEEPEGSVFRVGVDGGGCSGFQYSFSVVPRAGDDDILIAREGARLVIDETSLGFLQGARIDFIDDLMGQSFRIENPNAVSSCGCGSSFSI